MRVAILGTGQRCTDVYVPIIRVLPDVTLAGVCGRDQDKASQLAARLGTRAYPTSDDLLGDDSVDLVISCVSWTENASTYQNLATSNKPALIETPMGHDYPSAMAAVRELGRRAAPTVVAEQYHLRPLEVLKRNLIAAGRFGDVFSAFVDGVGHDYHGISLLRSYIGYEDRVARVAAMRAEAPLFDHPSHRNVFFGREVVQHALLAFESGKHGTYHWSWLSYESPIRPKRIAGFYGTKGSCWGNECVAFLDERGPASQVHFERRTKVISGLETLIQILAFNDQGLLIGQWTNPVPDLPLSEELLTSTTLLLNAISCCQGLANPLYTPAMAGEDHRVVHAIENAAASDAGWLTAT